MSIANRIDSIINDSSQAEHQDLQANNHQTDSYSYQKVIISLEICEVELFQGLGYAKLVAVGVPASISPSIY